MLPSLCRGGICMEMIKEMSIDLETYSEVDIKKSGAYRYVESPEFEILLFAVSINGSPVTVCGMDESLDTVCKLMGEVPSWAKGLELRADGYETMFYKKD